MATKCGGGLSGRATKKDCFFAASLRDCSVCFKKLDWLLSQVNQGQECQINRVLPDIRPFYIRYLARYPYILPYRISGLFYIRYPAEYPTFFISGIRPYRISDRISGHIEYLTGYPDKIFAGNPAKLASGATLQINTECIE